ncbi:dynein axonemal assembly factor 4 isoform 1-T1 [Salvelinus alpinus]|uniref:dynein axonemal assembly factor 4 isoform X2 n=1 Tax=Salvelinus sp. IW2-2015 TaxID=2691554 RepID=UPI000CEAB160|nr:dynein assembly factor 4, axonemal isoform X1 [Salvelinus alpinus]
MPLIVKDYTWTQTEMIVYINVPLKGVKVGKVDIFSTDEYLKVHFPPFLFEAFLSEPIDDDKSTAKIGNGVAVFTLQKKKERLWEHLVINNMCVSVLDDKDKSREIRERALLKAQEKLAAESKAKATKTQEERKYALETMMKLEEEGRAKIQKMKDDECEKATAQLEAWKLKQRQIAEEEAQLKLQSQRIKVDKQSKSEKIHVPRTSDQCKVKHDQKNSVQSISKKKQVDLPAPRSTGNIQIKFTPRVFPTALRESRVPEEEEWLQKQAEARRAIHADLAELKDLTEEERNPDWLKEKGDKLFATGNYLAAINAYSLAIKLNRKIPTIYSNRSACHLKLRNLHKAIEDSSWALDLLTPPVAANASARTRAHVRRGTAFCELELYTEGLQDYQAALTIDPQNETLQADTHKIRQIIQGSAPCPE